MGVIYTPSLLRKEYSMKVCELARQAANGTETTTDTRYAVTKSKV